VGTRILGTGSYLPTQRLTNRDLEKMVDTSDEWIRERTGINARHIAAPTEVTSDFALHAAQSALAAAGLQPQDLDAIIFGTVTPDQVMPSAACCLQAKLGCRPILAFDLSAACSGFLYGMALADGLLRSDSYRHVLVVGAETLSRIINYKDRTTCILFGDGGGAAVLGQSQDKSQGILAHHMAADGQYGELLTLPGGGSRCPTSAETVSQGLHFVQMKGREIFKAAVRAMVSSAEETCARAQVSISEIDWFIPHQANTRIIETVGEQLGVPRQRVVVNIEETGNTSSATIPVAFDEAVRDGRIQRGQLVLFAAFGGGLTSGSVLFRY